MSRTRRPVVVLHIGAMKTGTTFLQHVMIANRDAMAEAGFPLAGATWPDQVRATQDVLRLHQKDPKIRQISQGKWDALSSEMLSTDGVSVMSMEFLSFASAAGIRRIKEALEEAEVHVVLTVRDAQAVFPTQWQTSVTSGARHSWASFQRGVRRAGRAGWPVWRLLDSGVRELRHTQDVPAILDQWLEVVPPERFHVVTVPLERADPMELWRRFCSTIGLDPEIATKPPKADNPSLGFASTELVRRINVGLGKVPLMDYNRTVKDRVAHRFLAPRRHQEGRPTLDPATLRAALAWNARAVTALESTGVHVVGALTDLPTRPTVASDPHEPDTPPDHDVFEAAQDAAAGLVTMIDNRTARVEKLGGVAVGAVPDLPRWATDGHPAELETAVSDLVTMSRQAIALRGELFNLGAPRSGADA